MSINYINNKLSHKCEKTAIIIDKNQKTAGKSDGPLVLRYMNKGKGIFKALCAYIIFSDCL